MYIVRKAYRFEAAHQLCENDGKCSRVHGHSYTLFVICRGPKLIDHGVQRGMLVEYDDISGVVKPLIEKYLDHHFLNESLGDLRPTTENLARWIYDHLKPDLATLHTIEIQETATSWVSYCPYDAS